MKEVLMITKKLPERLEYKGQTLQILERSENEAIYYKLYQDDPVDFVIGLIFKIEIENPADQISCHEQFKEFDLYGERILFEHENRKSAMKHYQKLVRKHG